MAKPFVCIPKEPLIPLQVIVDAAAQGVRFTIDRRIDQITYLHQFRSAGVETYLTADTDTFYMVDWAAVRANPGNETLYVEQCRAEINAIAEQYRGLIDYLNAWNEFDGLGRESARMPAPVVNRVTELWREAFPHPQTLISASMVSGNVTMLDQLDLGIVDGIDLHLYASAPASWPDPMTGRFSEKLAGYRERLEHLGYPGMRIYMSEFGLSSWPDEANPDSETLASRDTQADYCDQSCRELFADPSLGVAAWYALHNWRGFGLTEHGAARKPSFASFQAATAVAVWDTNNPDPPPSDGPEFVLGFKDLADSLGGAAGAPIENQHGWDTNNGNHVEIQATDTGLMAWTREGNRCIFLPASSAPSPGNGGGNGGNGGGGNQTGLALGYDIASYQGEIDSGWCEARKAEGGEFVIVRHYLTIERPGLRELSRRQIRGCMDGGLEVDPYCWGYRTADPIRTIEETLELAAQEYGKPNVLWLDCETYTNDRGVVLDAGPDRDWLYRFMDHCTAIGQPGGIYTGKWWWVQYLLNTAEFWNCYLWYSNYGTNSGTMEGATLDNWPAESFGGWSNEYVVGKQFTSRWNGLNLDANVMERAVVYH